MSWYVHACHFKIWSDTEKVSTHSEWLKKREQMNAGHLQVSHRHEYFRRLVAEIEKGACSRERDVQHQTAAQQADNSKWHVSVSLCARLYLIHLASFSLCLFQHREEVDSSGCTEWSNSKNRRVGPWSSFSLLICFSHRAKHQNSCFTASRGHVYWSKPEVLKTQTKQCADEECSLQ